MQDPGLARDYSQGLDPHRGLVLNLLWSWTCRHNNCPGLEERNTNLEMRQNRKPKPSWFTQPAPQNRLIVNPILRNRLSQMGRMYLVSTFPIAFSLPSKFS